MSLSPPLSLAVLLLGSSLAIAQTDIRGLYIYTNDLAQVTKSTSNQIVQSLSVDGVDGITIVVGWNTVEPAMGQYDWTLLDQWINQAIMANKKIGLAIPAGSSTPSWLFDAPPSGAGAVKLSFKISPHGGATGVCESTVIAPPWDSAFLAQWDAMLAALSAHLKAAGTYSAVTVVRITGINRTTEELRLPAETPTGTGLACVTDSITVWQHAGYRPSLLLSGWNSVAGSFQKSFPDKTLAVSIIPSDAFPGIAEDGTAIKGAIGDEDEPLLQSASQMLPGQLIVQFDFLMPGEPASSVVTGAALNYGTMVAFQTNEYLGGNGAACSEPVTNPTACTAGTFLELLETGIYPLGRNNALRAQYIEVFHDNVTAFPASVLQGHNELFASIPPPTPVISSISVCGAASSAVSDHKGSCPAGTQDTAQIVLAPDGSGKAINTYAGMFGISDEHQTIFPPGSLNGNNDYLFFVASQTKAGAPTSGLMVLSGGAGPDANGKWTLDLAKADGYGAYPKGAYAEVFVSPTQNCPTVSSAANQDQTFDQSYAAPGSLLPDPTGPAGSLLMIYEGTNTCLGSTGGGQENFYSMVGAATSLDWGKTWPTYRARTGFNFTALPGQNLDQGPNAPKGATGSGVCMGNDCTGTPPASYGRYPVLGPSVSIATAAATGKPLQNSMGDSEMSAFLDDVNPSGNPYVYVTYNYRAGGGALSDPKGPPNGLMIARGQLNGGTAPLSFSKWNGQGFSAAGIGGYDSSIFPSGSFANCEGKGQLAFGSSIGYVETTQQYLLLFVCDSPGDPIVGQASGSGRGAAWFYSTSTDLSDPTKWTAPREITGSWSAYDTSGGCSSYPGFYPTAMSLGSKPGRLTATGYIFYLAGCQTAGTPPPGRQYSARVFSFNLSTPSSIDTPPTITTTQLSTGMVGAAYSQTLSATGGAMPYAWSVAANSTLPDGLSLSTAGVISGTPTTPGGSTFTIQLMDASSASATQSFTLTIAPAQPPPPPSNGTAMLTWIAGSSIELEQVLGDCDDRAQAQQFVKGQAVTCQPTASQTVTRFNILGNDLGASFEDDGKLLFLSGDTIGNDKNAVNYKAGDPIAYSTTTDGDSPFLITYYTKKDGSPLFVNATGLATGADDVPNAGISIPGDAVYIVYNTGADTTLADPQQNAHSVLLTFDETAQTFAAGRTISKLPGGHFVFTSLHAMGSDIYTFGTGNYRASDIYLSKTPASGFKAGTGVQYFTGMVNGQTTWGSSESAAVPVIQDNPTNGPVWPKDSPTVGNVSVAYSSELGLWLVTYDGGRQTEATRGIYFTSAPQPWGPWSAPQLIFNSRRDGGTGVFIHDPSVVPDPPGDGLNGPTIGNNDIYKTAGGVYAPYMIERFLKVTGGNTLNVYYVMSTWNPYTVVKMRSQLAITVPTTPVTISTSALAGGIAGTAYAQTLSASGGAEPYIWTVVDGSLPDGLTLSTAGMITGIPTTAATSTFTIQAADSNGATATQTFLLTIAPPAGATLLPSADGSLVYDVASGVTWLSDFNLAASNRFGIPVCKSGSNYNSCINQSGSMRYAAATAWVAAMNAANYLGHNNWQIPTTPLVDKTCAKVGPQNNSFGFGCTGSALGSLFFNGLSLTNPNTAVPIPTYQAGPFSNLQPYLYWSQSPGAGGYASFSFGNGFQGANTTPNFLYVLPMIAGKLPGAPAATGTALQPSVDGQTVYDPVTNITWLANGNLAANNAFALPPCTGPTTPTLCVAPDGAMSWDTATQWIANMNAASYLGQTHWALPSIDVANCPGYGCGGTKNPMGNLFYSGLGLIEGSTVVAAPNTPVGPFQNMRPYLYWTCSGETVQSPCQAAGPAPNFEWSFSFGSGFEGTDLLVNELYVTVYFVGSSSPKPTR